MVRKKMLFNVMEDWAFLATLGITMALLSFIVDRGIIMCEHLRMFALRDVTESVGLQYFLWVSLSMAMVIFSTGFVHLVSPQGVGSGIPEMKTILRGVELKGYLTFRTLLAKVVGLMATLGSGMPLGKEGPFVHIGGIAAQLVGDVFSVIKGSYEKVRNLDMLAAGCGTGISACFAAPVGGMLFSIEVTSTYFAVRNYWKRYFAALWGAIMFRLLAIWSANEDTIRPLFATNFPDKYSYNPMELFFFALVGLCCGLLGAFFVWIHRKYVFLIKNNKYITKLFGLNRFIYPAIGSFVIASITFPGGLGRYIAGDLSTHHQMVDMFNNITWSKSNLTEKEAETIKHWIVADTSVIVNLFCYFLYHFIFTMIAYTFPIPCGAFIPALKIGSGFGRLFGEVIYNIFPHGLDYEGITSVIVPGGYAIVGAAAFSGAVTRSIAVAVIVFELTGQLTHLIPVMIAVLIAYSVQALFEPSLYDSIIQQKKLPYLPDLMPSGSGMYTIYVENFTMRDVVYIWHGITYGDLKDILKDHKMLRQLPLVDSPETKILLGSVQRKQLMYALSNQVGRLKRMEVAAQKRAAVENYTNIHRRKSSSLVNLPSQEVLTLQKQMKEQSKNRDLPSRPVSAPATESRPFSFPFRNFFFRSSSTNDVSGDPEFGSLILDKAELRLSKRYKIMKMNGGDMTASERRAWETEQLAMVVDFTQIIVDPAPVQLVDRTPLSKVHSLFSMIGIDHAYVTNLGCLVGVVGLTELKKAIEDVNMGNYDNFTQIQQITTPEESPLLQKASEVSERNYNTQNTVTSIDSAFSVSEFNMRKAKSKETII